MGTGPNGHGMPSTALAPLTATASSVCLCKWSHWPQCIPIFGVDSAGAVAVSCKRTLRYLSWDLRRANLHRWLLSLPRASISRGWQSQNVSMASRLIFDSVSLSLWHVDKLSLNKDNNAFLKSCPHIKTKAGKNKMSLKDASIVMRRR